MACVPDDQAPAPTSATAVAVGGALRLASGGGIVVIVGVLFVQVVEFLVLGFVGFFFLRVVIRIAPAVPDGAGEGVFLRCRELFDETGTLLRADGRTVELAGGADDSLPSAVAILAAIHERLVARTALGPEGGTA